MLLNILSIFIILKIALTKDCNNPFYSQASFDENGVARPPYLSTPSNTADLKTCKMFNGKTSCCDKTTDDYIKNYFDNYKKQIKSLGSAKVKGIKDTFRQYEKVTIPGFDKTKEKELKDKIKEQVKLMQSKAKETNKAMNTCTRGALRASAGLLCSGCNDDYAGSLVNGKMAVLKGDCSALANQCMTLLDDQDKSQEFAVDSVMNITSFIAQEVGEVMDTEYMADNLSSDETVDSTPKKPYKLTDKFDLKKGDISDEQITKIREAKQREGKNAQTNFDLVRRLLGEDEKPKKKPVPQDKNKFVKQYKPEKPKRKQDKSDTNKLDIPSDKVKNKEAKPLDAASTACDEARAVLGDKMISCKLCVKPAKGVSEQDDQAKTTKIEQNFDSSDSFCQQNPLVVKETNGDGASPDDYIERSEQPIIPVNIKVKVTDSKGKQKGVRLPFVFTNKDDNDKMFKFLNDQEIDTDVKDKLIEETYNEVKKDVDGYKSIKGFEKKEKDDATAAGKTAPTRKNTSKKNINKAVGGNGKITECAVKGMMDVAGAEKSPMLSETDCTFKAAFADSSKTNICGNTTYNQTLLDMMFNEVDRCSNTTGKFTDLEMNCKDQKCRVCLDDNCFQQNFKPKPVTVKKAYKKQDNVDQFKKDPRTDPSTGRRVPEFVKLPNATNVTGIPFVKPCTTIEECATWFCSKFMKGPVANIEKIMNPQDAEDPVLKEQIKDTYKGGQAKEQKPIKEFNPDEADFKKSKPTSRILSSSVEIHDSKGVSFNEVAAQSDLDTTIALDGVTETSQVYSSEVSDGSEGSATKEVTNTNGIKNFFNIVAMLAFMAIANMI